METSEKPYGYDVKVTKLTDWDIVYELALATMGREPKKAMPSDEWKQRLAKAEHSPIRALLYKVSFTCPSWVSVHLVRHKVGVEHFVSTQRTDRTGVDRNSLPQNAPVRHTMILNAAALTAISRKRLCRLASKETRELWETVIRELRTVDPFIADRCVPECVVRGFCPELRGCGYAGSGAEFKEQRDDYVNG